MTDLVDAYQRKEIHRYEAILQKHKEQILDDPFIQEHIDEVTRNIRTEALLKLIKPFTRFTLTYIAKQLNISVEEVQDILGFLILDKKIRGKINQSNGTVEVSRRSDIERMESMQDWSNALNLMWNTMFKDGEGFKTDDNSMSSSMRPAAYV